jgi:hypothetical protein
MVTSPQQFVPYAITGFRREVGENCTLLGYCAASSVNFVIKTSEQPIVPIFKCQESKEYFEFLTFVVGTDWFFRNFDKKSPLLLAS